MLKNDKNSLLEIAAVSRQMKLTRWIVFNYRNEINQQIHEKVINVKMQVEVN